MHVAISLLYVLLLIASCKTNDNVTADKPSGQQDVRPFTATWDAATLGTTADFAPKGTAIGLVDFLDEASGLAVSRSNARSLWTHNDSGNKPYLYLIDKKTGRLKATYQVPGVERGDFEDIASGPGTVTGKNYLYFADIGDNAQNRDHVLIYRLEEPVFEEAHTGKIIETTTPAQRFMLTYPDGARDAETVLIDPATLDVMIVSKRQAQNSLYTVKLPDAPGSKAIPLIHAGTFPFSSATGGGSKADGSALMIRTYTQVFYWQNSSRSTFLSVLASKPQLAPYQPEPQGEAVCMDEDGYYTLSERSGGKTPVLWFYPRQ